MRNRGDDFEGSNKPVGAVDAWMGSWRGKQASAIDIMKSSRDQGSGSPGQFNAVSRGERVLQNTTPSPLLTIHNHLRLNLHPPPNPKHRWLRLRSLADTFKIFSSK